MKKAILALEDGAIFEGISFGAPGERSGEVVFNTSMSGYQEIITDPSYKGQFVVMTYPLIGNYGVNREDSESRAVFLEGLIVKEYSKIASSWRHEKKLGDFLKENNIMAVEGIDTRRLTLHIRSNGAMKGVLSTLCLEKDELVKKANLSRGLIGLDLVRDVTAERKYSWASAGAGKFKVAVLDCGVKYNILRELLKHGCKVTVFPADTSACDILKSRPDGLLLSNGPGDPAALGYIVDTVKGLLGKVPVFGICLGHQILGIALKGKTYKLRFGHHGANHPVKDLKTGKIAITSQNHGFCVDINTLNKDDVEITHINLNDKTLEGMRHKRLAAFSVQFHPEASPGPSDAGYLFYDFIKMMDKVKRQKNA